MNTASKPIGIFDSGVGGLTVANAILDLLPDERIIYFGDTAHLPYGEKSIDALKEYSRHIAHFLLDQGCKMIVVACNTASAAAYQILKNEIGFRIPIVNVVDPMVQLVKRNGYQQVAVVATRATIRTGVYRRKLKQAIPPISVTSKATPLLVHIIEEGYIHDEIGQAVLDGYFRGSKLDHAEAVLLACTHFPILKDRIKTYFRQDVDILDASMAVAHDVKTNLTELDLLSKERTEEHKYYLSDLTENFVDTARLFYPHPMQIELNDIWKSAAFEF